MEKRINFKWIYISGLLIFVASLMGFSKIKTDQTGNSEKQKKGTPLTHHTIWGSSSGAFPGEKITDLESWKRLNERIKTSNGGIGLEGRRSYDRAIPSSWSTSAMAGDAGLCKVSFGSFKPNWTETVNGNNNEAMRNFIKSIPDDRIVYLTFYHEPEDNVTAQNTLDVLQKAFAQFVDIVLTSGKPNVHPCFVLMTWTFKPQSKRDPDNYNFAKYLKPGQLKEVIAGLDGYADNPAVSAKGVFVTGFAKIATWGFTRFGIFETGDHTSATSPTLRSSWIKDFGQWVKSRNDIELVSWFNNGNGQHAGPKGWFLGTWSKNGDNYIFDDEDGTIAAYGQLLKN